MTPADLAALDGEGLDAQAGRMVAQALEQSGFDPAAAVARCRPLHSELCRKRGIALDDFDAACRVAGEVLRQGLEAETDAALAALKRSILAGIGARNRLERRRLQSTMRSRLAAARRELLAVVQRMVRDVLQRAEEEFSEAEDDFTRMMREAMEG